jgi:hypothetical protein
MEGLKTRHLQAILLAVVFRAFLFLRRVRCGSIVVSVNISHGRVTAVAWAKVVRGTGLCVFVIGGGERVRLDRKIEVESG